jgi:hypothetical protein
MYKVEDEQAHSLIQSLSKMAQEEIGETGDADGNGSEANEEVAIVSHCNHVSDTSIFFSVP